MIENGKYQTVQLFVTCLVDAFYPNVGMSVVTILERLGFTVEFQANQTCCGQIAFNAGVTEDAAEMARYTADVLAETDGYIVLPSGSCTDMIVHHYAQLLEADPVYGPKWRSIKARTFELMQFLVDELKVTDLGAACKGRVTVHPSCHGMRNLGLTDQAGKLLEQVDGLDVEPLPEADVCCGFGGLFAVKMGDISGAMMNRKLDHVESTGADTLVGSDVSCLMHLSGGLNKRGSQIQVKHIAEILAETDKDN